MIYIFHCADFNEIISYVIFESLKANGVECTLSRDTVKHAEDLWILNVSFFNIIKLPKRYIVYQTEPKTLFGKEYATFLQNAAQIWEYCDYNMPFTKNINPNAIYIPFRYNECIKNWHNLKVMPEKDIDILFMGHVTNYRKNIIDKLKENGLKVEILGGFKAKRELAIKRSKIILILNRSKDFDEYPQDISRLFIHGPRKDFMVGYKLKNPVLKKMININEDINELVKKLSFYLNNQIEIESNVEDVYLESLNFSMNAVIKENFHTINII